MHSTVKSSTRRIFYQSHWDMVKSNNLKCKLKLTNDFASEFFHKISKDSENITNHLFALKRFLSRTISTHPDIHDQSSSSIYLHISIGWVLPKHFKRSQEVIQMICRPHLMRCPLVCAVLVSLPYFTTVSPYELAILLELSASVASPFLACTLHSPQLEAEAVHLPIEDGRENEE